MQLQHDSIHEGGFITNGNPELQSHPSFTDRTGSLSPESYPSFIRRLSLSMKIRTILGAFVWASLPAMAENMTRRRSSSSRRSGCMNMSTVKECPNEEKAWRLRANLKSAHFRKSNRNVSSAHSLHSRSESTTSRRLVYATPFVFAPSGIADGYMNAQIPVP